MRSSGSPEPGHVSTNSTFAGSAVVLNTLMRPPDRSSAKMRPSGPTATACTPLNWPGPLPMPPNSRDVVHVAVENHHAVIVEAVRDENPAVRQKRHVLRLAEVRAVLSLDVLLAKRLQQLAAVVREHIDLTERLVDDPHAMFGIVRADAHPMRSRAGRALAQIVPLRPALLDVAVAVERVQAVLPDAALGGIEHVDADRARKPRKARRNRVRQADLATLRDEDPIGRFRENAGVAAERESGLGERLVPAADDLVGARTHRPGDDRLCGSRGLRAKRSFRSRQRQNGGRRGQDSRQRGESSSFLHHGENTHLTSP